MLPYALTVAALFLGCLGASALRLQILGVALFPFPIAACIVRGERGRAAVLFACAALALLAGGSEPAEWALYTILAGAGFPLGLGVRRRWSYGWTVTAVAALVYIAFAGAFLLTWSDWVAQSQAMWEMMAGQLKNNPSGASGESAEAMIAAAGWMKEHWAAIGLGAWMWPALIAGTLAVSAVSARFRRRWRIETFRGSFREMRTSEWLIWGAILTALLCFADYRWPGLGLRLVSWNSAVAFAAIYWLNGLSVFAYAAGMLRPNVLLLLTVVFLFVWSQPHPLLCAIGMFDTWAYFRGRLRRFAEARKHREGPGDTQ